MSRLRRSLPESRQAAAIAEFGTPQEINDAFVAHAGGRRTARMLLATGPAVGLCRGASLITAQVWTWPVSTAAIIAYGMALLCTVGLLAAAATTRHSYPRTRLGSVGAGGLLLLDAAMVVAVLVSAPHPMRPMAVAMPASIIRIGLTVASLPRIRLRAGA